MYKCLLPYQLDWGGFIVSVKLRAKRINLPNCLMSNIGWYNEKIWAIQ